jgi:hypothetical protein
MNEYVIHADQVSDHKLEFTWTPNPFPSAPHKFWVECPFDVNQIHGHDVFYPLLPLFLALGFDDTRFVSSLRKTSLLGSATIRAGEGLATLLAAVIIKYFVADIRARYPLC